MVKILCEIFLFVVAESLLTSGPATIHKKFPNQCYDAVLKKGYNPGDSWERPGECVQHFCSPGYSNETGKPELQITSNWCNKIEVVPPCSLKPGNTTLSFPNCCQNLKCPEKKNSKPQYKKRPWDIDT